MQLTQIRLFETFTITGSQVKLSKIKSRMNIGNFYYICTKLK